MTDHVWNGCVVPDDRLYDVDMHVWVMLDGDEAVLGMTDVAQSMGGRIVQVTWMRTGRRLSRGRPLAVVESAKWVGPFPTPLTGEVLAVNTEAFERDTLIANRDPYRAGWMARVRPRQLEEELPHLVDGATAYAKYQKFINDNDIRCYRCAD
jgi:glycine cleavage system H protein